MSTANEQSLLLKVRELVNILLPVIGYVRGNMCVAFGPPAHRFALKPRIYSFLGFYLYLVKYSPSLINDCKVKLCYVRSCYVFSKSSKS